MRVAGGELVWAAVLCGAVPLVVAARRVEARVRARRVLAGRRPVRVVEGPGERLRSAGAEWRRAVERWARGGAGRWRAEVLCVPVGAVVAVLTGSVLPLLAGCAAVPLVGRVLRRRADRAAAEGGAAAVGALCTALAGDLRAGRPPHAALADTIEAAGWPAAHDLSDAGRLLLSAARFGGDVPQALRAAAALSEGTRGLAAVAACWQVAVDGGAGLAAALDRVAAALRAEADQRDDLRAQLAGPRSTAALLALLPLFGVALGAGLGAHPARVLLHTPTGLLCLLSGALLEWAGLAWTSRIIRAAETAGSAGPADSVEPGAEVAGRQAPQEHGGLGRSGPVGRWGGPGGGGRREAGGRADGAGSVAPGEPARGAGAMVVFGGGAVHSLGTTSLVLLAAGGALAAGAGRVRERGRVRRLRAALGGGRARPWEGGRPRRAAGRSAGGRVPVLAAGAGVGVALLVGGWVGAGLGLAAAVGGGRWFGGRRRAAAADVAGTSEADPGRLPLCADLMAACLAAGAAPGEAAGAVGVCLGGPLGAALIRARAELRLGGDPVECWQRFGARSAAGELGRCLARASTTGSAPVAEMSRLAADLRAAQGRTALGAARRAAVLATAPLGLCFLPAFLLVGVAPVVIGLAGSVLDPAAH